MNNLVSECQQAFIKQTKKLKEPYRSWYVLHAKFVGIAAIDLDKKLDPNLLKMIGWLHDIAKIKNDKHHQKEGAKIAIRLLNGKIAQDKLEIIIDAIANHGSKGKPKTHEGKIIQCADKLSTFYPGLQKFIIKSFSKEELKKILREHYSKIKLKKGKQIAKKLIKP
jgi:HD superfamily phosphodiesterase